MAITRSKARSRQSLNHVASPRANSHGSASASNQNIPQQPSHKGDVSISTQNPGGCLTKPLASGNEKQAAIHNVV